MMIALGRHADCSRDKFIEYGDAVKVLVITSIPLQPRNDGKRVMLGGICDYFQQSSQVSELKIVSFASVENSPWHDSEAVERPSAAMKVRNVVWHSMLRQTKSIQESFFWNPSTARRLEAIENEFQPDLILYDTLRTGQYRHGRCRSASHVVYMDDLFSLRYERMLGTMKALSLHGLNALGNFAHHIPQPLLSIYVKFPVLQSALLTIEQKLMKRAETRAPRDFDKCLLISSREQNILMRRTRARNILCIPPRLENGLMKERNWHGRPEFVFLGALNVAHNAVAIESFLESHFQDVLELIPETRITVIGKGESGNLRSLAAQYPDHIHLRGYVEDIDEVLQSACAMILPLTFGTGVKIKIIDSLRCGLPLITTEVGIEGIELGRDSKVIVTDMKSFPAAMRTLLDHSMNGAASEGSSKLYAQNYSTAVVDAQYDEIFLGRPKSVEESAAVLNPLMV